MSPKQLETGLEGSRLAAWRAFAAVHARTVEAIDRDLAGADGLPRTWVDVLVALHGAPGRRLRMHELAEAVVRSPSGLSRLVDRLAERGLLERQPCSEDRRCQFATLTGDGAAALDAAWPGYAGGILRHFGGRLSDADLETLLELLDQLADRPAAGESAG
jgi:DNA-binding MarR family transcriptional regulator